MYIRFIENIKETINLQTTGNYQMPLIKKQNFDLVNKKVRSFNNRSTDCVGIHFFIDDYQFDRLWNNPTQYVSLFQKYQFICSPDYSLYLDYPIALQIYNTYKKQALGAYYQSQGIKVIPTVSWSNEASFDFCFDGIEYGSTVACSSVGCLHSEFCKGLFIKGFKKMIEVINPEQILMNGKLPDELSSYNELCIFIKPFHEEIKERMKLNDKN